MIKSIGGFFLTVQQTDDHYDDSRMEVKEFPVPFPTVAEQLEVNCPAQGRLFFKAREVTLCTLIFPTEPVQ